MIPDQGRAARAQAAFLFTAQHLEQRNPLTLLGQLQARYGQAIAIRYVQREPGAIVIDFAKQAVQA